MSPGSQQGGSRPFAGRITLVQLARFGDLLQTSPLIQNLQQDGLELTLLVDRRVASFAKQLEGVDQVVAIDLQNAPIPRSTHSLTENLKALRTWSTLWRENAAADEVILLNQGSLPSLIAQSIPASRHEGPLHIDHLPAPHLYLNASLADRQFNPIHLSEIWGAYGPTIPPFKPPALKNTSGTSFAKHEGELQQTPESARHFAINVGAGAAGRRPGSEKVAELVQHLLKLGATRIDLLGSPSDKAAGERILELLPQDKRRIRNLVGKTEFEQLPDILNENKVLISTDTGTLQLAAATRCRPLGLFFGGANPVETGPYCENGVALVHRDSLKQDERTEEDYLEALPMEAVAQLAVGLSETESDLTEFYDAFDPFDLLVAGPSSLGCRYQQVRKDRIIQFGAGERWLPLLEALIFAHGDSEGVSLSKLGARDELGRAERAPATTIAEVFLRSQPEWRDAGLDEKRWISGVIARFVGREFPVLARWETEQLEKSYDS